MKIHHVYPLLDGREVLESTIDPAKHRYIGLFRRSIEHFRNKFYACPVCPGGRVMSASNLSVFQCWQNGHYDVPQYLTIEGQQKPEEPPNGTPLA